MAESASDFSTDEQEGQPAEIGEILAAFQTDKLVPAKVSGLYKLGLFLVALMMVVLVLTFFGIIGAVGYWAYLVFTLPAQVFEFRTGMEKDLIAYISGILAVVAVFFLIKPIFAKREKTPAPLVLEPGEEPDLEAFVNKVADAVGARRPTEIEVDCNANAAAGFRRGIWSLFTNDLKLIVGLPLAGGMDLRSFGGIVAHEFGHFAQGTGMRLTYLIRRINGWFARVVYERDAWDAGLERLSRGVDIRLMIILMAMRLFIWLSRRVLWVLMHIGHGISCFAMRQMEYDADSYEVQFAGSKIFPKTSERLRMISLGFERANHLVAESWEHKGLARDLPRLALAQTRSMPEEITKAVNEDALQRKTGATDTHPSDSDRITASNQLCQPGIFPLSAASTSLFRDFDALSERATRHFYEITLELPVTEETLIDNALIEGDDVARQEALKALDRFLFDGFSVFHPIFVTPENMELAPDITEDDIARLAELIEAEGKKMEGVNKEFDETMEQMDKARGAAELVEANFKIKGDVFGLPGNTLSAAIEAERAAKMRIGTLSAKMETFDDLARRRIVAGLEMGRLRNGPSEEVEKVVRVLGFLKEVFPAMVALRRLVIGQEILLHQLGNENSEAHIARMRSNSSEMESLTKQLTNEAKNYSYPFEHPRGSLTLAELIAAELDPEADAIFRYYASAEKCMNQLYNLYVRCVGRLAQIAEEVGNEMKIKSGLADIADALASSEQ